MFSPFKKKDGRPSWKDCLVAAEESGDHQPVAAFLLEQPELAEELTKEVVDCFRSRYYVRALPLLMGLAERRAHHPDLARQSFQELLSTAESKLLSKQSPLPWHRLSDRQLALLFETAAEVNLDGRLVDVLDESTLRRSLPAPGNKAFVAVLKLLLRDGRPTNLMVAGMNDWLEGLAADTSSPRPPEALLGNCLEAARVLIGARQWSLALETLVLIARLNLEIFFSHTDLLQRVAGHLEQQPPLETARSAWLLRRLPAPDWVPALKSKWIQVLKFAREAQIHMSDDGTGTIQRGDDPSNQLSAMWNEIAIALGTCASYDDHYTHIDQASVQAAELEKAIEEYRQLAKKMTDLRELYLSPQGAWEPQLTERIILLQEPLRLAKEWVERLEDEHLRSLCPARLMMLPLGNSMNHPSAMLQAAAWMLTRTVEQGNLDHASKELIRVRLFSAAFEDDLEEVISTAIRNLIQDSSEEQAERVRECVRAFALTRDLQSLCSSLSEAGFDEEESVAILEHLRSVLSTCVAREFQERVIQLLPGHRRTEFQDALSDGLLWMEELGFDLLDLVQIKDDRQGAEGVAQIADILWTQLPQALHFFTKYPLRLMMLAEHRKLTLGEFRKTRCTISPWTHFTPPAWQRGMPVELAGKVTSRYMALDDRSEPNSMGIYFRLFRHPVLAVPVIYHEYLHFGGDGADVSQGIVNESELYIREMLFQRWLVARLAPEDDSKIPEFERTIVAEVQALSLDSLGYKLRMPLENDHVFKSFVTLVIEYFGGLLSGVQVAHAIARGLHREERKIQLLNATDEEKRSWCSEIEWPSLAAPANHHVKNAYVEILDKEFHKDHSLSLGGRAGIFASSIHKEHLSAWQTYLSRSSAGTEFRIAWPDPDNWHGVLGAVINRMSLAEQRDWTPDDSSPSGPESATFESLDERIHKISEYLERLRRQKVLEAAESAVPVLNNRLEKS